MALGNFIKKLIETNTIWGVRAKQLAGINDAANTSTSSVVMSSADSSIDFAPSKAPSFFKENQYIRVVGGTNDSRLLRVDKIQGTKVIVEETLIDDSGTRRITARLWEIHDDPRISRPSSSGSTMFNVHNRDNTGREDGSALATAYAEHYHDEPGTSLDDLGEIISTEYNSIGCKNLVQADCCEKPFVELGPTVMFDDNGNVLRERHDDDGNGVC